MLKLKTMDASMLLRNFIDTKNLSWPLAPTLELGKVGKLSLYLSPDIPDQVFDINVVLANGDLSKSQAKSWIAYFRKVASELEHLHELNECKND
ncbi:MULTISPECIES: hypothetical protein [Vibrio]|nr:hypothetical protein [Vibrio harveyi]HDY7429309.1 hypothetical protein [Vibrio vulnificus]